MINILPANAEDPRDSGSIPRLGRSPGGGNDSPLQDSCLENSMDKGTCQTIVHGVAKSQTWLNAHTLLFSIFFFFRSNLYILLKVLRGWSLGSVWWWTKYFYALSFNSIYYSEAHFPYIYNLWIVTDWTYLVRINEATNVEQLVYNWYIPRSLCLIFLLLLVSYGTKNTLQALLLE